MTNADKIRSMTDKQLARFLWIWKINSICLFISQGGQGSMNGKEMEDWIRSSEWDCPENQVGEEYIFDEDFNDKE